MKIKASLKNRTILDNGTIIYSDIAVLDSFYKSKIPTVASVENSDDVELYNSWADILGYDKLSTDIQELSLDTEFWNTPDKYKELDIEEFLLNKCDSESESKRVYDELLLYKERNMYPLLKHLVYVVDVLRSKDIVYGVGRGSCVSSYCLYLIGVHRVDSMKYGLDIGEFLK